MDIRRCASRELQADELHAIVGHLRVSKGKAALGPSLAQQHRTKAPDTHVQLPTRGQALGPMADTPLVDTFCCAAGVSATCIARVCRGEPLWL